jgi:hypothetical protein
MLMMQTRPASVRNGSGPTLISEWSKPTKIRPKLSNPNSGRLQEDQLDKLLLGVQIIRGSKLSIPRSFKKCGFLLPNFLVGRGEKSLNFDIGVGGQIIAGQPGALFMWNLQGPAS